MSAPDQRLEAEVPADLRPVYREILALVDKFCDEWLNDEYKEVCRKLAVDVCQEDSPIVRGKREGWASGIVYAAGWVNFLTDPGQEPHVRSEDIARGFGVSKATMQSKARVIREGLSLRPFDPEFTLPSRMQDNPLAWMVEINGLAVDARMLPAEIQQQIFELGLIPWLPGHPETRSERPHVPRTPAPRPRTDIVLQFQVTLLGSDPPIWRRIVVPDCTLDVFHEYLQQAMGWENCHLHEFRIGKTRYGDPSLLGEFGEAECRDTRETLLSEVVPPGKPRKTKRPHFVYVYDFGDEWEHAIEFEGFQPREKKARYPQCLGGERAGPPEDVGGVWGYAEFVEALADADHERHEEFREWVGEFEPERFDADAVTRWMRRVR